MSIKAFNLNFSDCDTRPKNRFNDWLDVLDTVCRYAKRDGLVDFSEYLERIHNEVSSFYPTYIVPKNQMEIFDYLSTEGMVAVNRKMKNTLTSNELEESKQWFLSLQQSDFFELLDKSEKAFKRAMKNKRYYSSVERNHLSNMLNLIKQSIEFMIKNI